MSSFLTDVLPPLAALLVSVSQTLTRSIWLQVFDNPVSKNPDCVLVPDVNKASNAIASADLATEMMETLYIKNQ